MIYLEPVFIVSYVVMPVRQYVRRMIRHPEGSENTGFRLKDCRNDRKNTLVYTQTLFRILNINICLGFRYLNLRFD